MKWILKWFEDGLKPGQRTVLLVAVMGLAVARPSMAAVYDPEITALVTLTNLAGITNGATITVNGATRTWTNNPAASPPTQIQTTNALDKSMTNLLRNYQTYAAAGPIAALTNDGSSTSFTLRGQPAQSMAVSFSAGWASVSYTTNYLTNQYPVNTPFVNEPLSLRTNQISEIIGWINTYASNKLAQTAAAMVDFVTVSVLQSMTNKNLYSTTNWSGALTNVRIWSAWLGSTNDGFFIGTNNGAPPWRGVLRLDTNGFLGLWDTNGVPLSIIDNYPLGNADYVPWQDLKSIFPSRHTAYYNVANQWNTINQWDALTNIFSANLRVWAGAYLTGVVAQITSNLQQWAWITNLIVPGGARSAITNFDGAANALIVTNMTALGGSTTGMVFNANNFQYDNVFATLSRVLMQGDLTLQPYYITSVANGPGKIDVGTNSFVWVGGSPTAAWELEALKGGARDGKLVLLFFQTGFDVTIKNESNHETIATDRIWTLNGGDSRSSGNAVGLAFYVGEPIERWIFAWLNRGTGTGSGVQATNAIAYMDGAGTNTSFYASGTDKAPVTINQLTNTYTNTFQVKSSAGAEMFSIRSNGVVVVSSNLTVNGTRLDANGVWLNSFASPAAGQLLTFRSGTVVTNDKISLGNTSISDVMLGTKALNDGLVYTGSLWTNAPTSGYTVIFVSAIGLSPADATIYYVGADGGNVPTVYGNVAYRVKSPGVIRGYSLSVRTAGTLGSNETVSHYVRLNDTTDVGQLDINYASAQTNITISVSQAVAANDTFVLKVSAPTWATNPTSVRHYAVIHIDPL